ncbi:MAG TPA: ABC transporter substrate-binding protein [Chloroflexota bacterium]|nr:ABC transporter substrate-binding protein [Chloroflexota bacterium]
MASCGGTTAPVSPSAAASVAASKPAASAAASAAAKAVAAPPSIVIATQPGIGYAPLIVMQEEHWLEQAMPNTKFEYKQLTSGSAIRDGMIAGQIQIGSGGVAPFLVGWDKGVKWRLMSSMNNMPLWLNVIDPNIKDLKAFQGHAEMKIAMPAPDSIQAVVLMKASKDRLGNAQALQTNVVAMAHPLGAQSLLSKQIAGHLTSPPFQEQEVEKGAHTIVNSYDVFGETTFNSVFVTEDFHDKFPEAYNTLVQTFDRALKLVQDDPKQAAELMSKNEQGKETVEELVKAMQAQGIKYTNVPTGFGKFASFMKEVGLVSKEPSSWKDLVFPNLAVVNGS